MELTQYKNNWKLTYKGIERWPLSKLFEIINLNTKDYIIKKRGHSFWEINHDNLEYIYYDAKKAYLNCVKKEHPDKDGNSKENDNIKNINVAWRRIKKIFAQHGIINGVKTSPQFHKKCKEHIQEIINLYNNNYTFKKIGKLIGINKEQVPIILAENLIPIRRRKFKNALVE